MDKIKAISSETFMSLRNRNFRLYFIGQAISLSGTWMQTIAQSWLILKLTGSGTALGIITALQFLPVLILGPFGGVVADRVNKRTIIYFTQTAAGITALILGLLVLTNQIQLWMIYVLALSLGLINTFDNPARQTFVLEMVGEENLKNAVALNSVEINLARVIGPTIAGILIATIGLAQCFIINGITYAAVLIVLYMMNAKELFITPPSTKIRGQLIQGFKYVLNTPILRNTLIMMGVIGTLTYEFTVTLPLFAQYSFHSEAAGFAALTSAMGVGSVIGGIYTARNKANSTKTLILSAFLFGISILAVSIAPNLMTAVILMVLIGVFSIIFLSVGNSTLQLASKPEMRGRVMSLWTVAFLGSTPIGGPIIGWISQVFGPRFGLGLGGFAAIVAGFIGLISIGTFSLENIQNILPWDTAKSASQKASRPDGF